MVVIFNFIQCREELCNAGNALRLTCFKGSRSFSKDFLISLLSLKFQFFVFLRLCFKKQIYCSHLNNINGKRVRGPRSTGFYYHLFLLFFFFFSFYLLSRWSSSVRSSLILQSLVDCPPQRSLPKIINTFIFPFFKK